eukprot:TRINITY_DN5347_c0_g1_i3.p1 TRINITY_DN5347_c0_g1~~TRINITY_DN5347_c0_g1_i3.p1  ORF type:complete len:153 (-),score=35.53 TRINITY_DN5347_c0_g1_i3:62-520(-)
MCIRDRQRAQHGIPPVHELCTARRVCPRRLEWNNQRSAPSSPECAPLKKKKPTPNKPKLVVKRREERPVEPPIVAPKPAANAWSKQQEWVGKRISRMIEASWEEGVVGGWRAKGPDGAPEWRVEYDNGTVQRLSRHQVEHEAILEEEEPFQL